MAPELRRSLRRRNLSKPVRASMVIDDMATDRPWTSFGIATVGYTTERVRTGDRALRLTAGERDEKYMAAHRTPGGSFDAMWGGEAGAKLDFDAPQDWSAFNRLSVWVHVGHTTIPALNLVLLINRDIPAGGITDPIPFDYQEDLRVGRWNHLYWDIPEFERSRVTGIEITKTLTGYPGEPVDYTIDRIELQRVEPEPYEGWEPGPAKIAYHHVGYRPGDEKIAITAAFGATRFELVDADSGRRVAARGVRRLENRRGRFGVLDFSDVTRPGRYVLRCGDVESGAFRIDDDVWKGVVEKGLNYFLGARCGFDVPGLHGVCHQDVTATFEGVTKAINGGWHDAGDGGTQNPSRTALADYALLQLLDRLTVTGAWGDVRRRVLEEAAWGLDYLGKIRFAPGVRANGGVNRIFSDNALGTIDDVRFGAGTYARMPSVLASAVSAYAARVLEGVDDARAAENLTIAEQDYATAPAAAAVTTLNAAAQGALAATQLWLATGTEIYRRDAEFCGRALVGCQQQRFEGLAVTGYFHDSTARTHPVNDPVDESNEDVALRSLRLLGEAFPDHPDWMQWYGAALLYSEYFHARGAETTQPYRHLPNRVWRRSEIPAQEESAIAQAGSTGRLIRYMQLPAYDADLIRRQVREHYEAGVPVGEDARLRINPLYVGQLGRGSAPTLLARACGLVEAAMLRNEPSIAQLARMQLQWMLGGNPFSQSLMYGEGYDYAPQFGNDWAHSVVGAVPLGISSVRDDAPYWQSATQIWPKETFIVPQAKIVATLAFLALPAKVTGWTTAAASFRERRTGACTVVEPGRLDLALPPGDYRVRYGGVEKRLTLLAGGRYDLQLDHRRGLEMSLSKTRTATGRVRVRVRVRGRGAHVVELRAFNGTIQDRVLEIDLGRRSERTLSRSLTIVDPDVPWAVVAVPDGNLDERQELFGTRYPLPDLA